MNDASAEKRTDYLTAKQLAEVLQVSETTIHRLRRSGRIPAVYVTDRLVRYILRDVRRALARSSSHATPPEAESHDDGSQMGFEEIVSAFSTE